MKVFFDTEFTGLHQNTTLVSIGMIDEVGHTFYAEFGDFNYYQCEDWVKKNILTKLRFHGKDGKGWCNCSTQNTGYPNQFTEAYGHTDFIKGCLQNWLVDIGKVELWSDCLSYDFVLFNQLWGHAFNIPGNVYYIPFDICTMFKLLNIDPDINREEFAGMLASAEKHNALWDAKVIKACYEKMEEMLSCTELTIDNHDQL